eukprot:3100759-Pyramimonas_sp.AAC.1
MTRGPRERRAARKPRARGGVLVARTSAKLARSIYNSNGVPSTTTIAMHKRSPSLKNLPRLGM